MPRRFILSVGNGATLSITGPGSWSASTAATVTVRAQSGGAVQAGVSVALSSSSANGVVASSPVVTNGNGDAVFTVTPDSDGGAFTLTASASGYPDATLAVTASAPTAYNEPAGFTPWFVHDFQTWPDDTFNDGFAASDVGWFYGSGVNNSFVLTELVDDPTAPDGSGKAVRLTYPSGHPVGSSLANWSLTSSPNNLASGVGHTDLRTMYLRYWVMFGDPSDTEWFDGMVYWRSWGTVNRHLTERIDGNGSSSFGARFRNTQTTQLGDYEYWYYDSNGDRGITPVYPTEAIVPGVWHRFEHLVTIVSQTECRFRCWINGTQYVDATDSTTFNNNINVDAIRQVHFNNNPSGGSSPTQDYYLRFSGVYVSGDPV